MRDRFPWENEAAFGLAKPISSQGEAETRAQFFPGTPPKCPPEGIQKFPLSSNQGGFASSHTHEATASWQWLNFLEARAPQDAKIVHINMDETSLKFYPAQARVGAIATLAGERVREVCSRPYQASLSVRRRAVTLVAFIADDCEVQRVLPQVIVGCKANIPAQWAVEQRYRRDCVYVCRRTHGWVNVPVLKQLLKLLGACLRPFGESHFFILSMDAAPAHMTASAARACHQAGVMPHLLPARTTSFLQPLDTHVFARLKRCIGQAYEAACLESETAAVSHRTTLDIFCKAADDVLTHGDHARAFHKCGLGQKQQRVGASLLRFMEAVAAPSVPADLPTLEQMKVVYAGNKSVPVLALFAPFTLGLPRRELATCEEETSDEGEPQWVPLRERLRSWTRSRGRGRGGGPTPSAASSAAASTAAGSAAPNEQAARRRAPIAVPLSVGPLPLNVLASRRSSPVTRS